MSPKGDPDKFMEVRNSKWFCNDCTDLCTVMTNLSSSAPTNCIKNGNKCKWKPEDQV